MTGDMWPDGARHDRGNRIIRNDAELHATQERILLFERILAEARRTYSLSIYAAMAEGYWLVIDKLQADIARTGVVWQTPLRQRDNPLNNH
jgi:hypothetical protein